MELNVDTVLVAVNDLHARTGKRVFTLIEIAEAIEGQRVTPPPGMRAPTDAHGNPLPELAPPVPAWVKGAQRDPAAPPRRGEAAGNADRHGGVPARVSPSS
jgi:hypothetical protein